MTQAVAVVATITARAGHREAVIAALKTAVTAVRLEPGCEQYVLHQDPQQPDSLVMIERWTSAAALDQHNQGAALQALVRALDGCADIQISKLTPLF